MRINVGQVEAFYWAARLGSLVAAAKKLNTTQSTISMRINKLEQRFGVRLFDRSHRTARLTMIGQELVPYANKLINASAEMAEVLVTPASVSGELRIGASETIALTWLPQFLRAVHEQYPKIELSTDVDLAHAVTNKLEKGLVDLALTTGNAPRSRFRMKSLGFAERHWIASPSLPLPARKLLPEDLDGMPIIVLAKSSSQFESVEQWFRSHRISYRRIDTTNSSMIAVALTVAGLGISMLPVQLFKKELHEGKLRTLDVEPPLEPREYFAMVPVNDDRSLLDSITDIAVEASELTKDEYLDTNVARKRKAGLTTIRGTAAER